MDLIIEQVAFDQYGNIASLVLAEGQYVSPVRLAEFMGEYRKQWLDILLSQNKGDDE